jgi:hypothetical protein
MAFIQQVTSLTSAITITPSAAGDLYVGLVLGNNALTSLSFSDGGVGNTYGFTTAVQPVSGSGSLIAFYCLSCKSGATTITITPNLGGVNQILMDEYSAAGGFLACQNAPAGTSATTNNPGTTTNAISTGSFTASGASSLVWGCTVDQNFTAAAVNAGTGFTARAQGFTTGAYPFFPEDQVTSATSVAATWTAVSAAQSDFFLQFMLVFTQGSLTSVPLAWIT